MNKIYYRVTAFLLLLCCMAGAGADAEASVPAFAALYGNAAAVSEPRENINGRLDAEAVMKIAQGILAWKKEDMGVQKDAPLLNSLFLQAAGTTPGDWFPIGIGRFGFADDYAAYLAVIGDAVRKRYGQPEKLDAAKATEWHRISLAVLAMGGDPTNMGTDSGGNRIDLIADGTYNRGLTASLGRQGINGWIWGLITLDAMRYEIPEGSYHTRDDIILEILRRQLPDGGFSLTGQTADPDITAMAVQALAPYYNSEKIYIYTKKASGASAEAAVRDVIDEALACLSALQLPTGDFESWGTRNAESTVQVTVALCALGIDPQRDQRFIKNGVTLLDGILQYRMPDGGFIHSNTYDPDNPAALPDQSNTMTSEQVLYCMAAVWRQMNGMRTLYDFRPEQSTALKNRIAALAEGIDAITEETPAHRLTELLTLYYGLPEQERCYVFHYPRLSEAAEKAGIAVDRIAQETPVQESPAQEEPDTAITYFTPSDRAAVDALPQPLTTEWYVEVVKLLAKLTASETFEGKAEYQEKLEAAKAQITALQVQIHQLNRDIAEHLYPFSEVTLADKALVDGIVKRYEALSPYDRTQITHYEDVVRAKTKIDNQLRAIIIFVSLTVLCGAVLFLAARRIRKRRLRRRTEMEALAAQFQEDEEDAD